MSPSPKMIVPKPDAKRITMKFWYFTDGRGPEMVTVEEWNRRNEQRAIEQLLEEVNRPPTKWETLCQSLRSTLMTLISKLN